MTTLFKQKKPPTQPIPRPPQIDDAARQSEQDTLARRRAGRAETILGGLNTAAPGVTRAQQILG